MDLLAMRPSQWRQLSQTEVTEQVAADVIAGLKALLTKVESDQDNGTEEAYVTAVELANAGLWEKLSSKSIANAVWTVRAPTIEALLSGVPEGPRLSIAQEVAELVEAHRTRNKRLRSRSETSRSGVIRSQRPKKATG